MSRRTIIRVTVLLAVSLVLMLIGRHSPLSYLFSLEYLKDAIIGAGSYGVVLFTVAYVVGTLMNIPGVLFLFIGFMVYNGLNGMLIGYVTTILAMVVHFVFARLLAGEALSEIKNPFINKQMRKLTDHPIRTTIILRVILFVSPPVNYALALSSIRFRDFLLGSMIALPINLLLNYALFIFAKDWLYHRFI